MAEILIASIVEDIITSAWSYVLSPVLSLSKSRYLERLRILGVKMKFLKSLREDIEGRIDEARTRRKVIYQVVQEWLRSVDAKSEEVEELVCSVPENESSQCLGFSCPNMVRRYRLNKEIDRMSKELDRLVNWVNFASVFGLILQGETSIDESNDQLTSIDESNDHANFDSGAPFIRVMEAVRDSEVDMIGVSRQMMAKVFQQVRREELFNEVVAVEVSHSNSSAIQSQLARSLNLQLVEMPEVGRAVQLWCRLNNGKRNLIILDGLLEKLNLMDIGIPIPDGNRGCKILLTSKNPGLWKNMQGDIDYHTENLSDEDAYILVKKAMGNSVRSLELRDGSVKTQ